MSELPPNIDAILASIRSRMNEDSSGPGPVEAPPPPPVMVTPDLPMADVGAIVVEGPSSGGTTTLEGLIRGMLEPMLKAWLDSHMPEIVEHMAQAEIKRLTGRG